LSIGMEDVPGTGTNIHTRVTGTLETGGFSLDFVENNSDATVISYVAFGGTRMAKDFEAANTPEPRNVVTEIYGERARALLRDDLRIDGLQNWKLHNDSPRIVNLYLTLRNELSSLHNTISGGGNPPANINNLLNSLGFTSQRDELDRRSATQAWWDYQVYFEVQAAGG